MKTLNRISDLEQYGLEFLTGEACALSQRLLFDMNEDGAALMAEYFGLPAWSGDPGTPFADNWNSTVNGKPALGSLRGRHSYVHRLGVDPLPRRRTGGLEV